MGPTPALHLPSLGMDKPIIGVRHEETFSRGKKTVMKRSSFELTGWHVVIGGIAAFLIWQFWPKPVEDIPCVEIPQALVDETTSLLQMQGLFGGGALGALAGWGSLQRGYRLQAAQRKCGAPSALLPGEWRSPEDVAREERARLRREAGIYAPTTQELRLLGGYPEAPAAAPVPPPSEPVPIYTPPPPGGGGGGPIKPF